MNTKDLLVDQCANRHMIEDVHKAPWKQTKIIEGTESFINTMKGLECWKTYNVSLFMYGR